MRIQSDDENDKKAARTWEKNEDVTIDKPINELLEQKLRVKRKYVYVEKTDERQIKMIMNTPPPTSTRIVPKICETMPCKRKNKNYKRWSSRLYTNS